MENEKHVADVDDYDDDNSLASLFCLCCAALGRALPRRGKQAALAESCENIAKTLKNCAIRAVFWRRPPQALLVFKTKLLYCAGLPRPNKRQLSQQFYQITHVENVTFFLRSFFLRISDYFFASLMLFLMMMMIESRAGL